MIYFNVNINLYKKEYMIAFMKVQLLHKYYCTCKIDFVVNSDVITFFNIFLYYLF